MQAIVKTFYADTPAGTIGTVIKSWTDPHGNKWHRLFFGRNASGQPLKKAFPENCLSF